MRNNVLTVGMLKKALEGLPEEMPVCVEGGEYDYTDAHTVDVRVLDWMTDDEGNELDEPRGGPVLVVEA